MQLFQKSQGDKISVHGCFGQIWGLHLSFHDYKNFMLEWWGLLYNWRKNISM